MYSILSIYVVILEPVALTTLEIHLGERVLVVSGSIFSKTLMFGRTPFSVSAFIHLIKETPYRGLRWITGRRNGLKRLVWSNIYPR